MNVKEVPVVVWIAVFIGVVSVFLTACDIYEGNFDTNDVALIVDTILSVLAIGLILRIKLFYITYVIAKLLLELG